MAKQGMHKGQAQVSKARIVWGADDEKNGHKRVIGTNWPFHQKTEIVYGVLKEECGQLMKDFFKKKR